MVAGPKSNVEQQILQYMETHPNAADTAEGIVMWWLGNNVHDLDIKKVEEALNNLVSQGLVRCRQLKDGHVLYSRIAQ